jgi:hypothetical protein
VVACSDIGPASSNADEGRGNAFFNIATLGVAVLAALFAGWSAYEAHKTRVGADEAAGVQAKEVQLARKAAEESAQAAKDTARATAELAQDGRTARQVLLVIDNVAFGDNEQASTPISFGLTLRNPSTTPARNLSGELWYGLGKSTNDAAPSTPKQALFRSELGPGEAWPTYVSPPIPRPSEALMNQLGSGSLKLVAVGFVSYDDLYGNKHTRRWCYQFVRGGQNGVTECESGNSSK